MKKKEIKELLLYPLHADINMHILCKVSHRFC